MDVVAKDSGALSTSQEGKARVAELEAFLKTQEQYQIPIKEALHGGLYARTAVIQPGVMATGVTLKADTILIVNGTCRIWDGDVVRDYDGYNVLTGLAGRKCAILTLSEVQCTTLMPTQAKTLEEAVKAYTDDYELLQTANRQLGVDV